MTTLESFTFHNTGRIGADKTDNSQRNISNTKFANYNLANHFNENTSNTHVKFATDNLGVNFKNSLGGLPSNLVDTDSLLSIKSEKVNKFEQLQLHQRPFATVPYLGKGNGNVDIESQLIQGEIVQDKKSLSTIMDKTFIDYSEYPLDEKVKSRINNPANSIEELAFHGWTRGGVPTRELLNKKE